MPTIPVNDTGAVIYYEDSGVPNDSSNYVTLVIVHGLIYHGAGFVPMFPYAASHNLRIIALNLRDYPNSSPYTAEELALFASPDVAQQEIAVHNQGLEIARFLKQLIVTNGLFIKLEDDGSMSGGVVLLTWSLGNVCSLSLLAHIQEFDTETQSVLARSLRKVMMYGPPHNPLGVLLPKELSPPLVDSTIITEDRGADFAHWVSYFWDPPVSVLTDNLEILKNRTEAKQKAPSIDQISPEKLSAITDTSVLQRSPGFCVDVVDASVFRANTDRALYSCPQNDPLSRVDVVVLWGNEAPSVGPFAAHAIMKGHCEAVAAGKNARRLRIVKLEGGNVFFHWHEPEKFVQVIADNIV